MSSPDIPQKTAAESQRDDRRRGSCSTERPGQRNVLVPQKKGGTSPGAAPSFKTSRSEKQNKPQLTKKASAEPKHAFTTAAPAGNITTAVSSPSKGSKLFTLNPSSETGLAHVHASPQKQSKFTWVKSQNIAGAGHAQASSSSQDSREASIVASASISNAGVASGSPPSPATISKRISTKKPRKLSPVIAVPKTSKYKWVSAQARPSRKPPSPKTLALAQRALEKRESMKKLRAACAHSARARKGAPGSFCGGGGSASSRYSWKAGEQIGSGAATGAARRKSAFHWTLERSHKGMKAGLSVASPFSLRSSHPPFSSSSSPGGFKLRSRMKIIRRSASRSVYE